MKWTTLEIEGMEPPIIFLPPLPKYWRCMWEGEIIPEGAEAFDWRDGTFVKVVKSVGTPIPPPVVSNALWYIPVRVYALSWLVS